jgi:hypothetical protein
MPDTQTPPFDETRRLLDELVQVLEPSTSLKPWQVELEAMEQRLSEAVVRIAVAGTVKSGKSTLVNALLHEDMLRRGAGVLTAALTRVRRGKRAEAKLRIKPRTQVHTEVRQAAEWLAQISGQSLLGDLALSRARDRKALQVLVDHPEVLRRVGASGLRENLRRLQAFLEGYESAKPHLKKDGATVTFKSSELSGHREWVTQDHLAVYLEDVLLQVPSLPYPQLELADCQGSDSPNPLHFARIQEYLAGCAGVVYVISSRTGIRESDLRLLETLRRLELLSRTLFVVNLDLSEHDSLEDRDRVLAQIREQLLPWVAPSEPLAVSALLELLSRESGTDTEAERLRVDLWRKTSPLIPDHEAQWSVLQVRIRQMAEQQELADLQAIETERWTRLVQGLGGLVQPEGESSEAVTVDFSKERELAIQQLPNALDAAFAGVLTLWQEGIRRQVRQLFDEPPLALSGCLEDFVQDYRLPTESRRVDPKDVVLGPQMALWYQDLRQRLLRFVTEELNADLLREIRKLEVRLLEDTRKLSMPFLVMLRELQSRRDEDGFAEGPSLRLAALTRFPDQPLVSFTTTLDFRASERLQGVFLWGKTLMSRQLRQWQGIAEGDSVDFFTEAVAEQLRRNALTSLRFDIQNYQENLIHLHLLGGLQRIQEGVRGEVSGLVDAALRKLGGSSSSVRIRTGEEVRAAQIHAALQALLDAQAQTANTS